MEKVVLTKEQAEFVEKWKEIKGIAEKLKDAIENGYNIESEFSAGDRVMYKKEALDSPDDSDANRVFTLSNPVVGKNAWFYEGENMGWDYETDFRHATSEEIYWLETLYREELGDFRVGDVFVNSDNDHFRIGVSGNNLKIAQDWYKDGDFKGLYPAESFKRYPQEEEK